MHFFVGSRSTGTAGAADEDDRLAAPRTLNGVLSDDSDGVLLVYGTTTVGRFDGSEDVVAFVSSTGCGEGRDVVVVAAVGEFEVKEGTAVVAAAVVVAAAPPLLAGAAFSSSFTTASSSVKEHRDSDNTAGLCAPRVDADMLSSAFIGLGAEDEDSGGVAHRLLNRGESRSESPAVALAMSAAASFSNVVASMVVGWTSADVADAA